MAVIVTIIILVVIVRIIISVIGSRPLTEEEKLQAKQKRDEFCEIFVEAARKGTDPKDIAAFPSIESRNALKNIPTYTIVKDICMELVKKGYSVGNDASCNKVSGTYYAHIDVYSGIDKLGKIEYVAGEVNDNYYHFVYHSELAENLLYDDKLFHMILLPYLVIKSEVSLAQSETPPEWLNICADVLKTYRPPVTDPDWVSKYPKAKKYINSMF